MTGKISKNSHLFIGKVVGTFGLRGALKLYTEWTLDLTDFVHKTFYIELLQGDSFKMMLKKVRKQKRNNLLFFDEVTSIDEAGKYIGSSVYINEEDLPREDEDIYFTDIENGFAYDDNEKLLGKIVGFIEQKGYDMLVIELKNGEQKEIPYLDEFIKEINKNEKKVIFFSSSVKGINED
ncbi:16S rRNA processing protein RimM [bacterium]|nr:16S rRNA processing protein RimM [bacterium]